MTDPLHVRRIPPIGHAMRLSREDLEDAGFTIGDDIPADAVFTLKLCPPGTPALAIPVTDVEWDALLTDSKRLMQYFSREALEAEITSEFLEAYKGRYVAAAGTRRGDPPQKEPTS